MKPNFNIEEDLILFALIKQDDASAFENIYNKYWLTLFNSAYKRLKDRDKCQDLVQNVFTDLWNRRNELEIQNLQAYLHVAARFQCLKTISQNLRQAYFVDAFETDIISSLKADGNLLEQEIKQVITNFIQALPSKRREIFMMHYEQELSTADIAAILDISQKTVQNQLTTASHALRLRLTHFFSCAALLSSIFVK